MRRKGVRVERYKPKVVGHMASRERAVLPCGCAVYVGRNVGPPHDVTTGAAPCSEEHELVTLRASEILQDGCSRPSRRLLVEAAASALGQAGREML